ncbi:MAG: asparagine synthase C-terminal domain-containing protein [Halolamina sp.]
MARDSRLLDGAGRSLDPDPVAAAVAERDPLPGTAGFAGVLAGADRRGDSADCDGRGGTDETDDLPAGALLVRDVLGRRPVWYDRMGGDPRWAFDPSDLADPTLLPAGHALGLDSAVDAGDAGADSLADGNRDERDPSPVRVWSLPTPEPRPHEWAVTAVEDAVAETVRAVDGDDLAVAFSGGVDSAVVAAGAPETPLYVAGFEGCHDVAAASEAAAAMGRDLRTVELTHGDLRRLVPEVVAATGRTNPMDVQIALPLFAVAETVAADGYDRLALGQGADELFGGYAKVVAPEADSRVAADTVRGARRETLRTLPDQFARDVAALEAAGVEPVAPLLHDRVVAVALRLPGSALAVAGDEDGSENEDKHPDGADARRKIALRAAAADLVPESVRTAEKKAVQYGTYVARELDRLARRAGYKRRLDDHVGRYVRALVTDSIGDDLPADDCGESG